MAITNKNKVTKKVSLGTKNIVRATLGKTVVYGKLPPRDTIRFKFNITDDAKTLDLADLLYSTNPAVDAELSWGDESEVTLIKPSQTRTELQHTYATAGQYVVEVKGAIELGVLDWQKSGTPTTLQKSLTEVRIPTKHSPIIGFTGGSKISTSEWKGTFIGCSNLKKVTFPQLFTNEKLAEATSINLAYMFSDCTGLSGEIPSNIFSALTKLTSININSMFAKCTGITGCQTDKLFESNTALTAISMDYLFANCKGITSFTTIGHPTATSVNCSFMFAQSGLTGNLEEDIFNFPAITSLACDGMLQQTSINWTAKFPTTLTTLRCAQMLAGCKNVTAFSGTMFNTITGLKTLECPTMYATCSALTGTIPTGFFPVGLTQLCCYSMFQGCSAMTSTLPTDLFSGLTALTDVPNMIPNGGTTESGFNCSYMFMASKVTGTAPQLPAAPAITHLDCRSMFMNTPITGVSANFCSGLTGLTKTYFDNTFNGCTSMTSEVPTLWKTYNDTGTHDKCFTGCEQVTNWKQIPEEWGGPPPVQMPARQIKLTFNLTGNSTDVNLKDFIGEDSSYVADWGDETPLDEESFSHTYSSPGEITITIGSEGGLHLKPIPTQFQPLLTKVEIPDDSPVFHVEPGVFAHCKKLTSIPSNFLEHAAYNIVDLSNFFYDSGLTSIPANFIPESIVTLTTDMMFYGCPLTELPTNMFPKTVTSLSAYNMFHFCSTMTGEVTNEFFPSGLNTLNAHNMFASCKALTTVSDTLGNVIPKNANLVGMFNECTGITSQLPELWTTHQEQTQHNECFRGCTEASNFSNVPDDWGGQAMEIDVDMTSSKTIDLTNALWTDPENTKTHYKSDIVCKCTIDWGDGNVEQCIDCSDKTKLTHTYAENNTYTITIQGIIRWFLASGSISGYATAIRVPKISPIYQLGGYSSSYYGDAFSGCTKLTTIEGDLFGSIVQTSGNNNGWYRTFAGDTALTSVPKLTFPEGATSLNLEYMFSGCTAITSVPETLFEGLPSKLTYLDAKYMFQNTNVAGTLSDQIFASLPESLTKIELYYMFYNVKTLTSLPKDLFKHLPSGLTYFGCEYFCYQTGLTEVPEDIFKSLPATLQEFYCSEFAMSTKVSTVPPTLFAQLPANLNKFSCGDFFYNCSTVASVPEDLFANLPSTLTSFGCGGMFYGCQGIDTVPETLFANLPSGITSLSFYRMFEGCNLITEISDQLFATLPESATSITFNEMFSGAKITSVPGTLFATLPSKITSFNTNSMFSNNNVTGEISDQLFATLPSGITSMSCESMFYNNKNLTAIPENLFAALPTGITSFICNSFVSSTGVTVIPTDILNNLPDQIKTLECSYMFSSNQVTELPETVFSSLSPVMTSFTCNGFVSTTQVTSIPTQLFANLPSTLTKFYCTSCFYNNKSVTSIPETIFANLPEGLTEFSCYSFCEGCSGITEITDQLFANLPSTLQKFTCSNMFEASKVAAIPENLFANLPSTLTSLTCGGMFKSSDVAEIPENLFSLTNTVLTSFSCGETFTSTKLTIIPEGLFSHLPETLTSISLGTTNPDGMFEGTAITEIPENLFANLPETVTSIYLAKTFKSTKSLTTIPGTLFANLPAGLKTLTLCPLSSGGYGTFSYSGITEIPEGLFDSLPENVTGDWSHAFDYCTSLTTIPATFGSGIRNVSSIKLDMMFYGDKGITSDLPELWNTLDQTSHSGCFRDCINASNYDQVPAGWK